MKTIPLLRYLSLLILSYASIATAQPVANFTANKTSGCSPLTIQFTSTSTGNPTSYLWSFGNSNTSIIQNPSATYVLPGTYTVSLNVTNSLGSDTKTITSYITVYANPTANFTANPVSGCIPLSAAFTNTSISGSAAITSWTWDFGNGNIGSTQNPTSTYSIASSYNVTLSVRDVNGCESTITKPNFITTSNAYTADFSATGKVNCVFPATVNFTSTTSVSGTYTYLWDFGDGTNSTQANPTKIYTTAGLYNVVLEVTAANGCKQVVTKNAFAEIGGVKANFTFTTTNDCAPSFVTLTNTTTPYPTGHSYRWLLDGGSSKTTQNASYNLTSKTSVIYLRVQTTAGCIDTIKKTITLQDPPTADFSVDSDYFCNFPATVNFTNLSSGGATQFSWNYGNSFGSGATNPVYTYNAVGQYKVKLIATRPNGCRDTIIKTVTVDGRSLVTIKDHNIKSGCAPYLAKFKVTDSRYRIFTTWKWQLNGTTISNNRDFDYTFNDTGKYVLKLTGTNAEGCFYEAYDTVEVSPEPLFDFVVDNNNICFNPGILKLMYVPLNNVVPDLVKWTIIGNTQNIKTSGDTIIVKLSDTGFYNVMAIASKKGCETTVSKLNFIRVNPAIADFDFRIGDCATDTVHFYNLSIGKNKISWDFDDSGATSTANDSTIHVYKKAGAYLVKLIATDTITGCKDTVIQSINIITPPKVNFSPLDTSVCMGTNILFKDSSKLDVSRIIKKWTYSLTDGRTVSTQNPSINFATAGQFGVTLTIEDDKKCIYSLRDSITVKVYGGRAGFTLSPTMGCVPVAVFTNDTSLLENAAVSRTWKWGNGDSLTSINNFGGYTYNAASTNQEVGTNISLTVTDTKGCKYVAIKNVKVYQPKAQFTYSKIRTCGLDSVLLKATINNQNVNTPATFKWWLPQGLSTAANSQFSAKGDTDIVVSFLLRDSLGCMDSTSLIIPIKALKPKIGFDGSPRNIPCITKYDSAIQFIDTSVQGSNPIIKREWRFGNGNIAQKNGDTVKAAAIYKIPGKYTVSLKITDSIGCLDSLTIPEFIFAGGPSGSYSFTPNRGCSPVDVTFMVNSPNSAKFIWDHADGDVAAFTTKSHTYNYVEPRTYYPRLTLIDSSLTCEFGLDAIDSIVVLPLPKPNFESNTSIICKNGFISFTNKTAPHPSPIYNWKWTFNLTDSSLFRNPPIKQYTAAGKFTVKLEATDTNGCYGMIVKDSFVTVNDDTIPPVSPLIKRATVIDNESVLLEYIPNTEIDFAKYIIYTNSNQFSYTNILDTSLLESGLNTLLTAYSYKMLAIDVCNNTSPFSEQHTTVELKAEGITNAIKLSWSAYQGFDTSLYYELWRKTIDENEYTRLTTVDYKTLNYIDTSVLCHQQYFYQIKSIETDSLLELSWSDTAGAIPIYVPTLPVPENIRATVSNNKSVKLEWHLAKHNRVFYYQIYRAVDLGEPVLYKTINSFDTVLIDYEVNVQEHSYRYTTYTIDVCGGKSAPSNIAQTILLSVKMVGNDILKHDPKLTWNEYQKWFTGVNHYNVSFYDDAIKGFELIGRNGSTELEAKHKYVNLVQAEYCYLITAFKEGDSSIISESNIACVSTEPRLFAPNVFTINNDNLNDVFYVKGLFVETFNLKIFNRWGERVFETTDINNGWDGTYNGEICKSDVYVYIAEGIGFKGQRKTITGNVTLLR